MTCAAHACAFGEPEVALPLGEVHLVRVSDPLESEGSGPGHLVRVRVRVRVGVRVRVRVLGFGS